MPPEKRFLVSFSQGTIQLITDTGQTPYAICVSPDAAPPERFAAEELRKYLRLVTGATLPLVQETRGSQRRFRLGTSARERLGTLPTLSEDGYVMKTYGADIGLVGGSPRATLYAVYHFLERYLGCGWCMPGDDALPARTTFQLGVIDDHEEPAFTFRSVVNFPFSSERFLREVDWMAKNRLNWAHPGINSPSAWEEAQAREPLLPALARRGMDILWGGHTFQTWIPTERYFVDHPEYFALIDGARRPQENHRGSLCVSNPAVQHVVATNMLAFADKNPGIRVLDLWMNDTTDWCACPACMAYEGVADYERFPAVFHAGGKDSRARAYYGFVNAVARLVRRERSNLLVSPLAYFRSFEPPDDVAMEPNVLVGFTTFARSWQFQETRTSLASRLQPSCAMLADALTATSDPQVRVRVQSLLEAITATDRTHYLPFE